MAVEANERVWPRIVVVGSLNLDLVMQVEAFPKEGETLFGSGLSEVAGGKGANQAAAVGKLGTAVSLIGKVGRDASGDKLIHSLQQAGVDTCALLPSDQPTGRALITVNASGHNYIVVIPGANADLTPFDIDEQRQVIEHCEMVVLQLEIPIETVAYTLRLAKRLGKTTILNPAPAPAHQLSSELLQLVDFLIPNEHELQSLTGFQAVADPASLEVAAQSLLELGAQAVLVTLGEKGCCYLDRQQVKTYPARKVEAVDTTAAGDSFIAGFAVSYLQQRDLDAAVAYAQQVAAITVTRHGAQSSLPTREEVEAFG
ncbi:ribokinase [Paenibacillus cremeus]|uniref:Ribokinase n=1 Tax=Paenibacillus cremeus TaxID=2163881 RepID=A0A559K5F7_9BACL|nr:ribokinase [Paenibacillus cremeus]TVY07381.1 ribokinase [Paenibacillus cremeus]